MILFFYVMAYHDPGKNNDNYKETTVRIAKKNIKGLGFEWQHRFEENT